VTTEANPNGRPHPGRGRGVRPPESFPEDPVYGVVCKPGVERAAKLAHRVLEFLEGHGQRTELEEGFARSIGRQGKPLSEMDGDMFVTVGGDGTILMALQHTERPIFAINSGAIGFLTEVNPKFAFSGLERVLAGDFLIEERSRLQAYLNGEALPTAANEVTLQSAKIAKMIKFDMFIGDEFADTIRGDGVVVATAMGSTGYAMSLGGPIIDPYLEGFVVVPIAPFRLANRPLIVPSDKEIRMRVVQRASDFKAKDVKVVVDGQHGYGMPLGSELRIVESDRVTRLVRFGGGFYERVRRKLMR
jgi:NAD+ kinase